MLYNNYISIKWNKRKERYPVISEVGRVETMKGPDLAQHKSSECRIPSMTTWQCGQFLLSWALVLSLHAGDNPSQRTTVYKNCPGSLLYLTSMSHSVCKQVLAPSRQHGLTPETSERKRRKHPRSWASGPPLVSPSDLLDSYSYSCQLEPRFHTCFQHYWIPWVWILSFENWLFYQGSCSPWCGAFSVLAISARRFSILSKRKPCPCPHK